MESIIYERKGGRGWVTIRLFEAEKQVPFGFAQGRLSTPRPPNSQEEASRKDKVDAPVGMTREGDGRRGKKPGLRPAF